MANTLAVYNTAKSTAVKVFIVQAFVKQLNDPSLLFNNLHMEPLLKGRAKYN